MTKITAAEPTTEDTDDVVGDAEKHYEELGAKSLATIRPEQQRWDENQVAILRQLGLEDATQPDLDLFFHYCRTTGLDPFRKQIYMIGRNTKVTEWLDNGEGGRRKVERYVTKFTIQLGIDGFRRNAREAAKRIGDAITMDGPYWCGEDGKWVEVWPSKTPPVAAKFTVFRDGVPHTGIAHYDEFVQANNVYEGSGQNRKIVGQEPNSMWAKMPRNQTAKCAEAQAYRKAYPDDFTGLILEDAAQPTVIDQEGNVESECREPARGGGVDKLRERARARKQEVVDAEVVEDGDDQPEPVEGDDPHLDVTPDAPVTEPDAGAEQSFLDDVEMSDADRTKGLAMLHGLLINGGFGGVEPVEQFAALAEIAAKRAEHRPLTGDADLSNADLKYVVNTLRDWKTKGKLTDWLGEAFNQASLREAGMLGADDA
jgi:phage recombination protein Bet